MSPALLVALAVAAALAPATDKTRFDAIIAAEWEWSLTQYPELATSVGDPRFNDQLTDLSPEAIAKRKAHGGETQKALRAIDRAKLDTTTQLDYDVLAFDLETSQGLARFPTEYLQIDHIYGAHTALADVASYAPRGTVKDYEDFVKRMERTPKRITQAIDLLEKGAAMGITMPRLLIEHVPALVREQTPKDVTKSPVYLAMFASMVAEIPDSEQSRLRERAMTILRDQLYPAYNALADYIEKRYLPKTRTAIGWSTLPDGEAWYAARIREQTSLAKSPAEIHELGLSEVRRIRAEMERVMAETKYTKGLPAFFQFLRSDKRFFYTDRDELLRGYATIAKQIDGELPRIFGKLPRLTYGVKPVPAYSEKVQTTAYYMPGSATAGRSGTFYCNTYDLKSRPKWEMEALTSHEAVPGHHLQIALAEETTGASEYRKHGFNNAYVEGWALYSESLGYSIGLYKDPYARFGQLTYEMWRAIRLVVDTGMHAKGWTRSQAIAYFNDNAGKAQHDIEVEVDRYIAWPAQALGYKLGQLEIKGLRDKAEQTLGSDFDLRAFHDVILGNGALPLEVLDAHVNAWIETRRKALVHP